MRKIFTLAVFLIATTATYSQTPVCPAPQNLHTTKITDTCARLNWRMPDTTIVDHIKIAYRVKGTTGWAEQDRKKQSENSINICGLTPNTTYEWQVRNICGDSNTDWLAGPDFTTLESTLPLQLLSFDAVLQKTTAILKWHTAEEINTGYFNIQRSFNSGSFTNIGRLQATGTSRAADYMYADQNVTGLQQPTIYYRLQMVDKDGSAKYSNIIMLKIENTSNNMLAIYPNPVKDRLHININAANSKMSIRITDMYGRSVYTAQLNEGAAQRDIDLSKLAKGMYNIELINGSNVVRQKFVKD